MSISSEISRISGNISDALTAIAAKGVTVPAGSNSDDLATLIGSIQTGGGGGMTATGTIVGNGANVLQIPCDFEPDLIRVYGDLSADVATRGIAALTIIKDMDIYYGYDSSTSASRTDFAAIRNITGYNESDASNVHATYSNNVLSIDTVINSGSYRWTSGITYSYKLIKFG